MKTFTQIYQIEGKDAVSEHYSNQVNALIWKLEIKD